MNSVLSRLSRFIQRPRRSRKLKKKLLGFDRIVMLGTTLKTEEKRRSASMAFYDPETALAEMDSYLWAVPTVPTPFVGDAPAPGVYGAAVINQQQFRHPTEVVVPRPANVFRIFMTGSSTAFSSGAPDDARTITGYLQTRLNERLGRETGLAFEVINATNPAWASTQERLWIELNLVEMAPDMIIQFSGNNEAHWGANMYPVDWMRTYAGYLYWTMINETYQRYGRDPLTDVAPRRTDRINPQRIAATLQKNVEQTAAILERRGVDYVFILHPTIAETAKPLSEREQMIHDADVFGPGTIAYFSECYRTMRKVLSTLASAGEGLTYLDHSDVFDHHAGDTEIFMDAYHFGDRGNELIADRILEDITLKIKARLANR